MFEEIRNIRNQFYNHLKGRGYSDAYAKSLADDYLTMGRAIGPFPCTKEMDLYYGGMIRRNLSPARLGNTIKMFKHWSGFAGIDPPDLKAPQDHGRRLVFLTEMEATRLLYACTDMRDYAMLCVMLYGGLRRSEVSGLLWDDIDSETRVISVRDTKTHRTAECVISEKTVKALEQWRGRCPGDRVFPVDPDRIGRIVRKWAKKAGIKKTVTPHVLRHTLATNLLLNGADITDVQRQLRHRDIKSTLIYLHVTTDEHRKRYDRFSPEF